VLFVQAGAVVTDGGGVLAHTAVIAREYGLPAVLATGAATQRLRDGDLVTVDGTAGVVTVNQGNDPTAVQRP
jgi:pyruvate,water dikinase